MSPGDTRTTLVQSCLCHVLSSILSPPSCQASSQLRVNLDGRDPLRVSTSDPHALLRHARAVRRKHTRHHVSFSMCTGANSIEIATGIRLRRPDYCAYQTSGVCGGEVGGGGSLTRGPRDFANRLHKPEQFLHNKSRK